MDSITPKQLCEVCKHYMCCVSDEKVIGGRLIRRNCFRCKKYRIDFLPVLPALKPERG